EGHAGPGFPATLVENQAAPKRWGHPEGKSVVGRDEALMRIRAAVDARNAGDDILIMAPQEPRVETLDEALARCRMFREIGADTTLHEAPTAEREMPRYCAEVDDPTM